MSEALFLLKNFKVFLVYIILLYFLITHKKVSGTVPDTTEKHYFSSNAQRAD